MKKSLFVFVVLVAISFSAFAQKHVVEANRRYSTAKIVQYGKGSVPVKDMTLIHDTLLSYQVKTSEGSYQNRELPVSKVRYVKIKKGSYVGIGTAAGAGIGLLSAVYGVLTVEADPDYDTSDVNWTPFIAGFTAGGALIGAITGLCIPKWRTYFLPERNTSYNIKISPAVSPYYCGVGVKIRF